MIAPRRLIRCREYQTIDELVPRLQILREKRERIRSYDTTVRAGEPDGFLLDEKQRQLLEVNNAVGFCFPAAITATLVMTIDVLQQRLNGLRATERIAA